MSQKKISLWPGMVAYTYNPSTLEGQGGWIMRSGDQDHPGQPGETPSLLKIQNLAGCGGICPATWEAEAGESLESQETEVAVSYRAIALQPGDRARLSQK